MGNLVLAKKFLSPKGAPTLQFKGAIDRTDIPADFFSANGGGKVHKALVPFVSATQSGNISNDYKFTILWSVSKEVYESVELGMSAEEVFGMDEVAGLVQRTTWKHPLRTKLEPQMNPTTGEVLTFEGKPIYQYTFPIQGNTHEFEMLGHEMPEYFEQEAISVATEADEDIFA